jgi:hypothetical protein
MHGEPIDSQRDTPRTSERDLDQRATDSAIMLLLLSPTNDGPWTDAELERELSASPLQVKDALATLNGAGFVHTQACLVLASHTAQRMDQLRL